MVKVTDILRRVKYFWHGLIEASIPKKQQGFNHLRLLNSISIFFSLVGAINILETFSSKGRVSPATLVMLPALGLSYYFGKFKGNLRSASLILIVGLTCGVILNARLMRASGDISTLYYLIVVMLLAEFFLYFHDFLLISIISLFFVFIITQETVQIFIFLMVFNGLALFFSYHRHEIERRNSLLYSEFSHEKHLLAIEKRRSAQMGLLQEIGQTISNSLNQKDILQNALNILVNRFEYAEVAISLLNDENKLEVAAIAGVQDFGYRPGYVQEIGVGIIGQTAEQKKTYLSQDVAEDPHYFSSDKREGSALGVPIMHDQKLIGVLYTESNVRNYFADDDIKALETLSDYLGAALQKAKLHMRTNEQLRIISTVKFISDVILSTLDLGEIFKSTVNMLNKTIGYTYVSIYSLEDEYLHLGAQIGYPENLIMEKIHKSQGISGRAISTKEAQFIEDVTKEPNFLRASYEVTSEICVPLIKNNDVVGTLNIESGKELQLTNMDLELLNLLAGPIALALENARLHAQVKVIASTDAVSGLLNRHEFEKQIYIEVQRAERYNHPLSLIILDVDSFKEYNDTYGHPAGDVRLKETANLIKKHLRNSDIAARYGGDEFAIILPNTNKEGALQFAKRLQESARSSVDNDSQINDGSTPGHTLSMGIATFPEDGDTLGSLLLRADHAELKAKQTGKNKIILASEIISS